MKQITFVLISAIFISSCACLKKNVDTSNSIILTEKNLTLLDGKYERFSKQQDKNKNDGDLYWNFFDRGQNRNDSIEFFELKVIDKNRILVLYIDGNDTIKSKTMKGKIKSGYFEFKRKYLFIPGIYVNLYRDSKFRIRLSNDNNLIADYKQIAFGTAIFIIPFYEKNQGNNMIFKRIENKIEEYGIYEGDF